MNEPRRLWTVARANRSLPLVARIAADAVARADELGRLAAQRQAARCEARETIERQIGEIARELERFAGELAAMGCDLKDPRQGLVDFPARNGDRAIYLCWAHGEAEVAFWHPVETGFSGRRPVSELPATTRGT
ncbi:MAG: DUF2203 family protein [Planctomycetes bacterium]|nr:DUF2203 family protein [Planctomycetota bacterium]